MIYVDDQVDYIENVESWVDYWQLDKNHGIYGYLMGEDVWVTYDQTVQLKDVWKAYYQNKEE